MKQQRVLFASIIALAVLIVAAVWVARNLPLLQGEPVVVSVLYSTEKEGWLTEVIPQFEATQPRVNGRPIKLEVKKTGSRDMYLSILDGREKPDLISPASSLQASILQDLSAAKFGQPLARAADPASCRRVVNSPLVLAAWRERADALWGAQPSGDVWRRLHDVLVDPKGWEAFGHPEWGYVKFGHTDPLKSNSGLMAILLMTYDYFDKTSGLTAGDILSNPDYQEWFLGIERSISQFGESTGDYMKDIVAYGPSMYDLVAVYESVAMEQAGNAAGRYGDLRVYYPPATVMSDHPFCVLSADWVSSDEAQAARLFVDYLLARPAQELALMKYGFRPADPAIDLNQPGSPFDRYAASGVAVALPPEVEVPPGAVLNTLLDFWSRNAQK
jgi:ABC-type Fe3+ transport system substrate-binding protein